MITEQTVDWRWARLVLASDWARATPDDTTLCDEPVSTTKSRRRPPSKRTATPSETSPGDGVTVRGTFVPCWPCVSDGWDGAQRSGEGRRLGRARHPPPPAGQRARPEIEADGAEAGEHVGAEQADGLALPAHLGKRRRGELLG